LHAQSTAVSVVRDSGAGRAVTFTEESLPATEQLASSLAAFVRDPQYCAETVRWDAFDVYSARNSTKALVDAVDSALQLFEKCRVAA
jgi:hypothetical protein